MQYSHLQPRTLPARDAEVDGFDEVLPQNIGSQPAISWSSSTTSNFLLHPLKCLSMLECSLTACPIQFILRLGRAMGQGKYAASNRCLDSFVQFRHGLELSASAIDIGAIEDVGYVSQSPTVLEHFKTLHFLTLSEQELLESVELAIEHSKPCQSFGGAFPNPFAFGIGLRSFKLLHESACRLIWKRDIRFAIYRNLEQKVKTVEASQGGGLQSFYSIVDRDASYLLDPAALQMLAWRSKKSCLDICFELKKTSELTSSWTISASTRWWP